MAILFTEEFEDDGNGSRYTLRDLNTGLSLTQFTDNGGDYFTQTDGSNISGVYTGPSGTSFFAAQDTDGETPNSDMLRIEFNQFDISGFENLSFAGLFAEDTANDGNEDWDADTLVYVEASIDGGAFTKILQFASQGATNTEPGLDTDFDGIADGTALTDTFTEFTAAISGTGSTLDLRITMENLDAGDEDIAFDNVRVTGDAAGPVIVSVLNETFDDTSNFTIADAAGTLSFFSDGGGDYFGLNDGLGGGNYGAGAAPSGAKAYTGADGSYLEGQDLDGEGATLPVSILFSSLDISNLTNLSFSGDFAEFFDSPGDIDSTDFLLVEYQIDGGGFQNLLAFEGADFTSGSSNGNFRQDTDFDGEGDGTTLTDAFQTFTAGIAGTGALLDLRFSASVNAGDEDFAADNFVITGEQNGGGDVTAPTLQASTPADDAVDVDPAADLVLSFDETVQAGTGNITIFASADDSVIETIDVTGMNVSFNGTDVTINPTSDLANSTSFYVQVDATAIEDAVGNAFVGIADETTFNFTTADAAPVVAGLISEFQPNPAGSDPANQSFELSGIAGETFSGWILSIESDPGSQGTVDRATQVSGTYDVNGLLTVSVPDLENPSFTVVLTDSFTGTAGSTDIDTDDDGVADDVSTIGTVFDAIGVPDNQSDEAFLYGSDLGGADFAFTGAEPQLIFRDASVGDLYAVNIAGDSNGAVFDVTGTDVTADIFDVDPTAATDTFGAINPTTAVSPLISEFQPNPTGTDPDPATVELSGQAGEAFSGWIISIESDSSSSTGLVDRAAQVSGTFDANGLLTVSIPDLENPSFTIVLLDDFTGTIGVTDIDTDDDGVADDLSSFGTVFDAIGTPDTAGDEAFLYGAQLGGTDFAFTGDEPRLIFREGSFGDLYAINDPDNGQVYDEFGLDVTPQAFDADPTQGTDSFGALNPNLIPDVIAPSLVSTTPADGAANVFTGSDLVLTFDERVVAGSGNITIFDASDDSVFETFDVNGSNVSFDPLNFSVTIDPTTDLAAAKDFYMQVDNGAITDNTGNAFAGILDTVSFNFTTDDGILQIGDIQGSAATYLPGFGSLTDASPFEGQTVTISGIVIGDYQEGNGADGDLNGFYIQDLGDGDAASSDGIFIFTGDASIPTDVSHGDTITVTGLVEESFGLTQIDATVGSFTIDSSGFDIRQLVTTVDFTTIGTRTDDSGNLISDLEAFEGMLIDFSQDITVVSNFNLDRFGEVLGSAAGRISQFTQDNLPDVAGYASYLEAVAQNTFIIDDGFDGSNNPIQRPDGSFSEADEFRLGDTSSDLFGVLDYDFDQYRLRPVDLDDNGNAYDDVTFDNTNPRPLDAPEVGGTLQVASMNVLNFFTTLDENGNQTLPGFTPFGADNQSEFDRQLEKLVNSILDVDADVTGLIEVENDFDGLPNASGDNALDPMPTLVAALNAAGGTPGQYAFVDPGVNSVSDGPISSAFIYDTTKVKIADGTTVAILNDSVVQTLPGFAGSPAIFEGRSSNRPPIAVTFEELATGEQFTAVINHYKAKGPSSNAVGDNADSGDGQNTFVGTRLRASQALAVWLETNPTGTDDGDVLLLGDFNSYAMEDPIRELEANGFTNLTAGNGADNYSFTFDGQLGQFDYGFANELLLNQVTGAAHYHINADEPDALDYNTDFNDPALFDATSSVRHADHDPVVVGLRLTNVIDTPTEGNIYQGTPDNDVIVGSFAAEQMFGDAGDDVIEGKGGNDEIFGEDGNDTIMGDAGRDFISGGLGNDDLNGGASGDAIYGGEGNDILRGRRGSDYLDGGAGNDKIWGDGLDDIALGGTGDDFINGGGGNDRLSGDEGADFIIGGAARDQIFGGDGDDRLEGRRGSDLIDGGAGNDLIFGNGLSDDLFGGTGNDTLLGAGGSDALFGEAGDDILSGGAGNDFLSGGAGVDVLTGNRGADTFFFATGDEQDEVTDFQNDVDTIDLTSFGFASVDDVTALMSEINGDVIFASSTDTLTIRNTTIADLTDDIAF